MMAYLDSSVSVTSRTGSVRGMDGGVQRLLNIFQQKTERLHNSPILRKIREEERGDNESGHRGKVVLYTTSIKAIRNTHEMCKKVLHILQAHQVALTVKDVFLHPDYAKELSERMGTNSTDTPLPQLFVADNYIGNGQVVIEMNERGELEELVQDHKSDSCLECCKLCAGQRFVPCLWCQGSKKGIKNTFNDLKCTVCNQNGLQLCPECTS